MLIKKGTVVDVNSSRKGRYVAIAKEDFDTEKDEWYPLVLAEGEAVNGMSTHNKWVEGEEIPARRGLCKVTIKK